MSVSIPPTDGAATEADEHGAQPHGPLPLLALGALGVVYGDIGTSPLYALRECFLGEHDLAIDAANVLGILSLIFWSLVMVISVKYLTFVMRADNHGEGGILALLSLTRAGRTDRNGPRPQYMLLLAGLFAASLLYGEGVITPAISVLSAVEGLAVATDAFDPFILPITIAILIGLFAVQYRGTAGIGAVFGPMMLVWFSTIGVLGFLQIVQQSPDHISVLQALDPRWAVSFLAAAGEVAFFVLGSVVLVITGGEALYADMGHFGPRPIRWAWYLIVLPGLLLNYFGQGVLLLENGAAVSNPFFELAPAWGLYPLVGLATAATIIASQALISGSFSLTQAAVQLGYMPRFTIVHTSETAQGQIYIPAVNRALMVFCILLVLGFQESSELADAYGMAVMGTMTTTTFLFYAVARERWGWSRLKAGATISVFLLFDLSFLGANLVKFFEGGWFPLAVGAALFAAMTTWKRGRAEVGQLLEDTRLPLEFFLQDVEATGCPRVPGTAVVMTSALEGVPSVLLHHFKHNKVLHERVVLMSFVSEVRPEVPDARRLEVTAYEQGFYRVTAQFGFMETPRVPQVLELCAARGLTLELPETTFFLGRETLLATGPSAMATWRKRLFAILQRNAPAATAYYGIPPNRVVELGAQLEL